MPDGLDLVSDAHEFHKGTVSLLGTGVRVGITRKSAVSNHSSMCVLEQTPR